MYFLELHNVDHGNPSFLNSSFLCRRFMLGQDIQYKHFHLQTKRVFGRQHYKSEWIFLKEYDQAKYFVSFYKEIKGP